MTSKLPASSDVVVVGAGNAAFCAALAAAESRRLGARARAGAGGRSPAATAASPPAPCAASTTASTTCGALMPDLTDEEIANTDFGTYTEEQFFDDMGRVTEYRTDPELCELLVTRSNETMLWMRDKGVRFAPIYGRQAFKVDGKFKFWGGLTVEAWGGGPGLVEALDQDRASKNGITIAYEARALSLIADDDGVKGVRVRHQGKTVEVAGQVRGARLRRLRGQCRDGARAISVPAGTSPRCAARASTPATASAWRSTSARMPTGNWSGCHAVGWDRNAPEFGDLDGRRQLPEALLSVRHHDQRQRRALRRRGRRLPQLHLRQVRPRDPDAARAVRLADLRRQGAAPAARRVPHQARDQGARRHARGAGRRSSRT